jgi:hypothetical protein
MPGEVELVGFGEPLPVAAEERMRGLAGGGRQQALAWPEAEVLVQAQWSRRLRADDAAELFEQGVGIQVAERPGRSAVAVKPAAEGIEADLPADGHMQGFERLAVAQEFGLGGRHAQAFVGLDQEGGRSVRGASIGPLSRLYTVQELC